MSFSDDNIKELKDEANKPCLGAQVVVLTKEQINDLLVRLEAAEEAVEQAYRCTPENKEYYDKWLKASGKEE